MFVTHLVFINTQNSNGHVFVEGAQGRFRVGLQKPVITTQKETFSSEMELSAVFVHIAFPASVTAWLLADVNEQRSRSRHVKHSVFGFMWRNKAEIV